MRKNKVQRRAADLGIALIEEGDCIILECPAAYRLVATQAHVWQEAVSHGMTMPYIWQSLWDEMKDGIEPCDGCQECEE